jgi:hypothetical protein
MYDPVGMRKEVGTQTIKLDRPVGVKEKALTTRMYVK